MDVVIRRASYVAPPPPAGLTDGGAAFITGSGFGTNPAVVRSLKSAVEAQALGTAVYNMTGIGSWSNADGVESSGMRTVIGNTAPLYGTKCLEAIPPLNDGRFGIAYDTGGTVSDLFVRDYIRINSLGGASTGQWKWIRFNANGGVQDSNPATMYMADWFSSGFDFVQVNGTGWQTSGSWGTAFNTWYEREVRLVPSSGTGVSDGRIEVRIRRVSDFVETRNLVATNVNNYGGVDRIRYLVFQNYQGNDNFNVGSSRTQVFMDGTYISNGSQKRLYLANASTWAAITAREIQDFTGWVDGRIDFTVRKGILSSLDPVWAYVADASGNINTNGYAVTAA